MGGWVGVTEAKATVAGAKAEDAEDGSLIADVRTMGGVYADAITGGAPSAEDPPAKETLRKRCCRCSTVSTSRRLLGDGGPELLSRERESEEERALARSCACPAT
jgi:hypothetical protein